MPTKKPSEEVQGTIPDQSMELKELATLLIRHYGHSEGFFDLVVQFQIGTGSVSSSKEKAIPGAIIGLAGVGLKRVEHLGPNSVDAAVANPPARPRKRRKGARKKS